MPLSSPHSTGSATGRALRPLPALAFVACLAVAALGGCSKGDGEAGAKDASKGPDAIPVEVTAVARRPISASYSGTAPLEARGEATVTARAAGIVKQVDFDLGSTVRAGQRLVQLDTERARLTQAQALAQMNKLEANYLRARQLAEQAREYLLIVARSVIQEGAITMDHLIVAGMVAAFGGDVADLPADHGIGPLR